MTYYPLHVDSPWIGVHNLTRSVITYQDYLSNPWVTYLTYYVINWHTLTSRSIYQIPLKELLWPQISWSHVLWITQGDTLSQSHEISFIENTCCHQSLSTMTQSIGIYDHFRVSLIGQSLLLILTSTQYPFKVESLCSIVS